MITAHTHTPKYQTKKKKIKIKIDIFKIDQILLYLAIVLYISQLYFFLSHMNDKH